MRILLIRLRLIGDVVFTTPAIRALRHTFSDARLDYLVEPHASGVVTGNPHLDEVLVIPKRSGAGRLADDARWAVQLRRRRYDLVIDFHGGPRSALLTRATGAPARVGYGIPGRRGVYTVAVQRSRELLPRHSVVNQWDLLRPVDPALDRPPEPAADAVEMRLDPHAAARIDARLAAAGVRTPAPLVVIHVSAGNPFRRWPEQGFVDVAAGLHASDGSRRIILTAGPSDREATARVAAAIRQRTGGPGTGAVLEMDDLGLAELHALVSRAALFIGGDSGPLHVAATTRVPIVGIYGPTLAARSAPWRDPRLVTESLEPRDLPCRPCDQRTCTSHDYRCLADVTPAHVLAAAGRALSRATLEPPR